MSLQSWSTVNAHMITVTWPLLVVCARAANVSILGVQYNLFTHAHHRFGLNDAFDRSVEILLQGPALRDADDNVWVRLLTGAFLAACAVTVIDRTMRPAHSAFMLEEAQ